MDRKTDYERVAPEYDRRYERLEFDGIASVLRAFAAQGQRVLEVGCGTGHWLAQLEAAGCVVTGVEPSQAMIERAAARGLSATLLRGRAEALPLGSGELDRVLCVNAIHHFTDIPRFLAEARRVLRPGGRLLSIAMDPSLGRDSWAIYDYFTPTFALDCARYPATPKLREQMVAAGFEACETVIAERIVMDQSARDALDNGLLARSVTSQLTILSDTEYQAGIDRIRAELAAADARGEALRLKSDLYLYATFGSVPRS